MAGNAAGLWAIFEKPLKMARCGIEARFGRPPHFYILMSFGCITVKPGICLKSSISSKVRISVMPLFFIMTLWIYVPHAEMVLENALPEMPEKLREIVIPAEG